MRTSGSDAAGGGAVELAFDVMFEAVSPRLYGYVRRHCAEGDCDDVVAEVFLVAWRRFAELPSDPLPWLLSTARRVLANHWRGRDRRARLEAEVRAVADLAGSPDPAGLAVDRAGVLAALGVLAADDRELLLLVGWDGLDAAGAAHVLGCSPVAARARLSRARRRLQAAIDETATEPLALTPRASSLRGGN